MSCADGVHDVTGPDVDGIPAGSAIWIETCGEWKGGAPVGFLVIQVAMDEHIIDPVTNGVVLNGTDHVSAIIVAVESVHDAYLTEAICAGDGLCCATSLLHHGKKQSAEQRNDGYGHKEFIEGEW